MEKVTARAAARAGRTAHRAPREATVEVPREAGMKEEAREVVGWREEEARAAAGWREEEARAAVGWREEVCSDLDLHSHSQWASTPKRDHRAPLLDGLTGWCSRRYIR